MNIDIKANFNNSQKETGQLGEVVGIINKNIALAKVPTEELLAKCELIDQKVVHEIGQHYQDVYGAPDECVDRLDAYRAYVVPEESYLRLAYSEIATTLFKGKNDVRDLKGEELATCLELLKVADGSVGVCDTKGKRWLVREKQDDENRSRTFHHESLHAMADFDDVRSGFQTGEGEDSHNGNEAVVEILERADFLQKDPSTLMLDILDGKLKFVEVRKKYILMTLIPMCILQGTKDEMSYRDLAKYYWKGDMNALMEDLEPRVEKNKNSIGEEKMKLLKRAYEVLES